MNAAMAKALEADLAIAAAMGAHYEHMPKGQSWPYTWRSAI